MSLLVLCLLFVGAFSHNCIHEQVQSAVQVEVVPQQFAPPSRKRSTTTAKSLRVHVDYTNIGGVGHCKESGGPATVVVNNVQYQCTQDYKVTQAMKNRVVVAMEKTKRRIAETFNIIRPSGGVKLSSRPWCRHADIDIANYRAGGTVDTDLVIIATAWPAAEGNLAWAAYCQVSQYGRPIAAHINFNPLALTTASDASLFGTAMHEIFHAMGFTSSRYDNFLTADGQRLPLADVLETKTLSRSNGKSKVVKRLKSQHVLAAAREHFDCPSLTGVELEDHQIGDAIAGSHWEERVFNDEVMTPVSIGDEGEPKISHMTLAYFHDMGVYWPNYQKAERFVYGKGRGCSFPEQSPTEFSVEDNYRCADGVTTSQCDYQTRGFSSCSWLSFSGAIADWGRTTNDPKRGGRQFADFLPQASAFVKCDGTEHTEAFESFGAESSAESRCIFSDVIEHGWRRSQMSAMCYKMRCSGHIPARTVPPVDCAVSQWGQWSSCTNPTSCGQRGSQKRTRTISVQPKGSGAACPQLSETRSDFCSVSACPVDCQWSAWSATWPKPFPTVGTKCTFNGRSGVCSTQSVCNSHAPSQWVRSSDGAVGCGHLPGAVRCCVSNENCGVTCGKALKTRTRLERVQASNGGKPCPGSSSETRECVTGIQCTCQLSDWSSWSACDKSCGTGKQKRTRTIQNSFGSPASACGELSQERACNNGACAQDCLLSGWQAHDCSKSCGGGTQTLTRHVIRQASNGGAPCSTVLSKTQSCNTQQCVSAPSGPTPCSELRTCSECQSECASWCSTGGFDQFGRSRGFCTDETSCGVHTRTNICHAPCSAHGSSGKCKRVEECGQIAATTSSCSALGSGLKCCIASRRFFKRDVSNVAPLHEEAPTQVNNETTDDRKRSTSPLVEIKVDNKWFPCPAAGGEISIETGAKRGKLQCPPVNKMCCSHLDGCSGNGVCLGGACMCDAGWKGLKCSVRVEAPNLNVPDRSTWTLQFNWIQEELLEDVPEAPEDEGVPDELPDQEIVQDNGTGNTSSEQAALSLAMIAGLVVVGFLICCVLFAVLVYMKKRQGRGYAEHQQPSF